jgi:LPPG:FO 2-phospho-L-lactate transferase
VGVEPPNPASPAEGDAPASKVVVLAGGTGGAKLARGMLDVVGAEELVVIVNTGDDIDIYGGHVSPDPDLVSFWLADLIDERGWGIEDDTFAVMDALRELGADVWFNLGDRDLAWCLERRRMTDEGLRPTEALARLNEAIGVHTSVLPMCDERLRTWVRSDSGWRDFQRFMIQDRAQGPVREVAFRASDTPPHPTPEVVAALARSNPVISIWPILHVLAEVIKGLTAPVVCVSPVVGGEILKGPTEAFLEAYDQPASATGVASFYKSVHPGLLDGIVADESVAGLTTLEMDTTMHDTATRALVAAKTLAFAESLAG